MNFTLLPHDPRAFHQPQWTHDSDLDEAIDHAMSVLSANAIKQAILAFARHYEELGLAGIQFSYELRVIPASPNPTLEILGSYSFTERQRLPWPTAADLRDADLAEWEARYSARFAKVIPSALGLVLANFIHEGLDKESLALALGERLLSAEDLAAWTASLEAMSLRDAAEPVRLSEAARARL